MDANVGAINRKDRGVVFAFIRVHSRLTNGPIPSDSWWGKTPPDLETKLKPRNWQRGFQGTQTPEDAKEGRDTELRAAISFVSIRVYKTSLGRIEFLHGSGIQTLGVR